MTLTIGNEAQDTRWKRFEHPMAFWFGAAACTAGVILHIPMYYSARGMGYRMAGMPPDGEMLAGMALIVVGLASALYGLVPTQARRIQENASRIRFRALDDARMRPQHIAMVLVVSIAVLIDVMKPAALSFVTPGMAKEYGLKAATNPHGGLPVGPLPLCGISGTSSVRGCGNTSPTASDALLHPLCGPAVCDHVDLRRDAVIRVESHHVLFHGHRRGWDAAHHVRPARRDDPGTSQRLADGPGRRCCRGSGARSHELAGRRGHPALQLADPVADRPAYRRPVHCPQSLDSRIAPVPDRRGEVTNGRRYAPIWRTVVGDEEGQSDAARNKPGSYRQLFAWPLTGPSSALTVLALGPAGHIRLPVVDPDEPGAPGIHHGKFGLHCA